MRRRCLTQLTTDQQLKDCIATLANGTNTLTVADGSEKIYSNLEQYLQLMSQDQTWGTALELLALARILQRPIVVLTPDNVYDQIIGENAYEQNEPIFLNYVHNNHYEPLVVPLSLRGKEILAEIRDSIEVKKNDLSARN